MRRKGIWSSDGFHYAPSRRAMREQQLRQLVLAAAQQLLAAVGPRAVRSRRAPTYPYGDVPAPLPRQFFQAVVDLLKEAKTRGELKPSVEPRQVAVWVAALWWHELTIRGPRFDRSQPEAANLADQLDSLLGALSVA